MDPTEIEALFAREGGYRFSRWGRPIVPVVFGVDDATLSIVKGAIEAVVGLAGHKMAENDPELGVNLMVFFFREWGELRGVPHLEKMVPGLSGLVDQLEAGNATQYRGFRFDDQGGIQAAFVFVRMSGGMEKLPAETIALTQAVMAILSWGERAFAESSPLAKHPETGAVILRPDVAGLIRAAYDPILPICATDPAHALRLFARLQG